jgi:hypothetical protein
MNLAQHHLARQRLADVPNLLEAWGFSPSATDADTGSSIMSGSRLSYETYDSECASLVCGTARLNARDTLTRLGRSLALPE